MKKLLLGLMAVFAVFMFSGCNEQVHAGHKGKILTPNGWAPEVYPPSRVWINNNAWNLNHDKLYQIETTTSKYVQPIKVLLKDKLTLRAEIVFRGRVTGGKDVLNGLFDDMKHNDQVVTTDEVYNKYGKMIVLNTAREVISRYTVDEVNTNYARITTELYNALKPKLDGLPIDISDVTVGNIEYPSIVTEAIEKAKERRMTIEREEAQVQIELTKKAGQEELAKADYRIKMIEAKRIRDYNAMTAKGITADLLELRRLELREKELDKWDGKLPGTLMGGNVPVIISAK